MTGAEGVLIINVAAALLFAAGYTVLAVANPSHRSALGFAVSYLFGMISPLSDLLGPRLGAPVATEWASYVSFLVATLSISITYPLFFRQRAPVRAVAAVLGFGLIVRASISAEPQDTVLYGLVYQLPFAVTAVLAARTVLSLQVGVRALSLALGGVFALIAGSDLTKPLFAVALSSGRTLETYTRTDYALVSQLSSGLLLLAAGLLLMIVVAQKAITESQVAAETDPLSGLLNRRGFDRRARVMVDGAHAARKPLSAAMFDLDHFKQINDRYGHEVGDRVIAAAAAVLRAEAPPGGLVGRMGGEEFALLMPGLSATEARWRIERLRAQLAAPLSALPPVTASGGLAQLRAGETLGELMRRADLAAYEAKRAGRDRLCESDGGRGAVGLLSAVGGR